MTVSCPLYSWNAGWNTRISASTGVELVVQPAIARVLADAVVRNVLRFILGENGGVCKTVLGIVPRTVMGRRCVCTDERAI